MGTVDETYEDITLKDVRRLVVRPGDILVLRVEGAHEELHEILGGYLRDALPEGVKVLVLEAGSDLEVVSGDGR